MGLLIGWDEAGDIDWAVLAKWYEDRLVDLRHIHVYPGETNMSGSRLNRLAAVMAVSALAGAADEIAGATTHGRGLFNPDFGKPYDAGSLARGREQRKAEREARREEAMSKAQARRNARNAKRRAQRNG